MSLQPGPAVHARRQPGPNPDLAGHWVRIRDSAGLSDHDAPELLGLISGIVNRAMAHELEVMGTRYRQITPAEVERIFDVAIPSLNKLFGLLHMRRLGQLYTSLVRFLDQPPPS